MEKRHSCFIPALRKLHIVGLCGKAIGPLAIELAGVGYRVTGSDDRPLPPISDLLAEAGIFCQPAFAAENVPPDADLVLANAFYGPDNPEIVRAKELGLPVTNFARFLGETLLRESRNAVVAGSYGKTTTASMLAWILEKTGLKPSWLVGGDCPDLGKHVHFGAGSHWVLEGDEYRSGPDDPRPKFSYYRPEIAIITALDHVHQDQFASFKDALRLYEELIDKVPVGQHVFAADQPEVHRNLGHLARRSRIRTVGFEDTADMRLSPSRWEKGRTRFALDSVDFELRLRGDFVCVNAALAASAAASWGVDLPASAAALAGYHGVRARQEVIADHAQLTVIYDMGIYPKALTKVARAVRESAAGRRLGILFQPRYTMGHEDQYYGGLASAFANADCVLVTEAPVPQEGVSGWFAFDPVRFRSRLSCPVREVGPALECYPQWEADAQDGDVWLILTEPMFPEPLGSIREYCHRRGFASAVEVAA